MAHPIIGWEETTPVPDHHKFTEYLHVENGRLHIDGFDLTQLFTDEAPQGLDRQLPSPLEVVYLPLIRQKIDFMNKTFAIAIEETGYEGKFHYAYATKANAAEEVIRTTLGAGANHEMSSAFDVIIAKLMVERGLLKPDKMVICNGFKEPNSAYSKNIIDLKDHHDNIIPVLENLEELAPFMTSGKQFELGLRQKSYGKQSSIEEMDASNSRFGMDVEELKKTADYIAAAPNLSLKMYHAMVGSQLTDYEAFVSWTKPMMEIYAQLRQQHKSLSIFNWGGGTPIGMTLDFEFDYLGFAKHFLTTMQEVCKQYRVPVPDVMGEFGRYTTSEHGVHVFKVITAKDNKAELPWYIINGSIMSSFPDSWALSEHFICLPLNNLDKPFQQVRLGGITCDSDDTYPRKDSQAKLFLPVDTEELYLGFFSIGAYQEMLGGVGGSKHCMLPEALELVLDRDENGNYIFEIISGQSPNDVLTNLGYNMG